MMTWLAPDLIWPDDVDAAPGTPIRLLAGACATCGRSSFPATSGCTWCGAATEAAPLASSGKLVAATAVLHKTPGSAVEVPYPFALLRFEASGLDVLGTVVGVADPDAMTPGTPMTVVAASPFPDGRRHFAFRAAS
jgi:uncharacterized OB-fold protein